VEDGENEGEGDVLYDLKIFEIIDWEMALELYSALLNATQNFVLIGIRERNICA
jgi:hypothetical protein